MGLATGCIIVLYIGHIMSIIILLPYLSKRVPDERKGFLLWVSWISSFLPFISELFGLIVWQLVKRNRDRQSESGYFRRDDSCLAS